MGDYNVQWKMRPIDVLMHLTIHKIGFHLKFPATLSLELEIDKKNTTVVDGITLGKESIIVNKEMKFQTVLNYDETAKVYEDKKASILICIKTKTSDNKLTSGVVVFPLCNPTQHQNNLIVKPIRCNDPKAFIEYSLRSETIRKNSPISHQTQPTTKEGSKEQKQNIFKSAVHYNNNWNDRDDETNSNNELEKYLSGSIRAEHRKRYKSSGKLPINSMQNCEQENSRTEVMTLRKDKLHNDCSIVSSKDSLQKQAKELSKYNLALNREIGENRIIKQNLTNQNKQLKSKLSSCQRQIDEKTSQIATLSKKYELKETSSHEQIKQLRAKLSEAESQLHLALLEKNQSLNQRETKEKEFMALLKEKDKQLAEEKRKNLIELQLKNQEIESLSNERNELQLSLNHSQKIESDLIVEIQAKRKQIVQLQASLQALKNEINEKQNDLQGLKIEAIDKGKANDDLKAQKKLIYEIKQERDQKEMALNKSKSANKELQLAIIQKDNHICTLQNKLESISKENQGLKIQVKEEAAKQAELIKKLKDYEIQLKRSADNSTKISNQIKEVESELKGIKRQATTTATEKTKMASDYESIIASLQQRAATFLQEKEILDDALYSLNTQYKQKEDECYDLGQQLIISKEEIAFVSNELELAKEENNYLNKVVEELTEKEERLMRAQQKIQYNERLYEDLQQRLQLQKIEYENEIRGLEDKAEERQQAFKNLSQQLRKVQKQNKEMFDEIQTLRFSLNTRTTELNYLKLQNQRNRDNTIQFQQRMALLRKTEEAATSNFQEVREENETFKRMIKENAEALTAFGKRYDSLNRSTVESLKSLLELVRSGRNIINSSIRHEKPETSTLLNDCIRQIATKQNFMEEEVKRLKKELEEQSDANRQNVKVIKLKTQMQKQLEDEMVIMKAFQKNQEAIIAKLTKEVQNHLQSIKQKENTISDLKIEIEGVRKDYVNQLAKKDEMILKAQQEKARLSHQIELNEHKHNKQKEKINSDTVNLQKDLQAKIASLNQTIAESGAELRQQRENIKLLKAKINELESLNAKMIKQKHQITSDIEKRTNDLISARLQSEERAKELAQKETQYATLQKHVDKLSAEKEALQSKLQKAEEAKAQLSMRKSECEGIIKERNNEIVLLKLRIDEGGDSKNRLAQQKEELIKSKGVQEALISTLNQNIKSLKEASIKSEDLIKKALFDKECCEKEYAKKLNILNNEKITLERQFNELKLKNSQKQNELTVKQRTLTQQLKVSKAKVIEHSSTISELKKEIELSNSKLNSLSKEFSAKIAEFQSKEKSLLPNADKLKEVMQSITELRNIGKEYDNSKTKLLRLTNITPKEQDYERGCEVARELGISINKMKIQVLNKFGLSTEVKTNLLESLKSLQMVSEKLSRR